MSKFQFRDDSGKPIDSQFEVLSGELILHSRGGTIGSPNARNTQYGLALQLLLERIHRSELKLGGVWVDSSIARNLPLAQRAIYFHDDVEAAPQQLFKHFSDRMAAVGRSSSARRGRGNSTKRLRFTFSEEVPETQIARIASWGETDNALTHDARFPASMFEQVNADHVWRAVQRLDAGGVNHPFGESTDYDVIADDNARLPPKAVFGLAASEALGIEVLPRHFRGGLDTPCFRAIINAGYRIVPKGEEIQDDLPPDPEERSWAEGNKRLVSHLRSERSLGLARAKRREFKREHGRLYCEKCELIPEEVYGFGTGESCIEVHHMLPLSADHGVRKTTLKDLICVCANCHRIIHRKIREKLQQSQQGRSR